MEKSSDTKQLLLAVGRPGYVDSSDAAEPAATSPENPKHSRAHPTDGRLDCAGSSSSTGACSTSCLQPQAPHVIPSLIGQQLPRLRRFMEKHRVLLNVLLRRSPELLQGSLAPLLRAPRFIDFDNKRAFFRACVRASRAQAERRSQSIYVRREQVRVQCHRPCRAAGTASHLLLRSTPSISVFSGLHLTCIVLFRNPHVSP